MEVLKFVPASQEHRVLIVSAIAHLADPLDIIFRLEGYHCAVSRSATDIGERLQCFCPHALILDAASLTADSVDGINEAIAREGGIVMQLVGHAADMNADFVSKLSPAGIYTIPVNVRQLVESTRWEIVQTKRCAGADTSKKIGRRRLTPREKNVVDHIVQGLTNKEIALKLGLSPRTIEIYRANAIAKLGARTTADLVRIALTQ